MNNLEVLKRNFYARNSVEVAKELLGKLLVRELPEGRLIGKIVEVEAYRGSDDPASHAYRGKTPRNEVMFSKPGLAYIYFTYGMHYCLNVKAEKEGIPGAVLIRALEPLEGIKIMKKNRQTEKIKELTNGPAKLTKAMKITKELNGWDLTKGKKLFICKPVFEEKFEIVTTSRIGISAGTEKPWRFYIKGNPFVSCGGLVRKTA